MLEKELEEKFKDAVRKAGGKAYKFTSPGNDGVPDEITEKADWESRSNGMLRYGIGPSRRYF